MKRLFLILLIAISFLAESQVVNQLNRLRQQQLIDAVQSTVSPVLMNFRIVDSNKDRIYFDSSKPLESGSTVDGFVVSYNTISSVTIVQGAVSGHYFTVSTPFTYWDNAMIYYVGNNSPPWESGNTASNIVDAIGNTIKDFTLTHVVNNINEPTQSGGTTYYVDVATGSDSDNGLSEVDAFATIAYGAAQLGPGDILWVKAGNYGAELNIDVGTSGTATNPIKIKGYKTTPGDLDGVMYYTYGDGALTSSEMPYLVSTSSNNDKAFYFNSNSGTRSDYVFVENFQIEGYWRGVYSWDSVGIISKNMLFYNNSLNNSSGHSIDYNMTVVTGDGLMAERGYSRILECLSVNASNAAFGLSSSGNLIDASKSYSDITNSTDDSQDYFYDVNGSYNIIINSLAHRLNDNVSHLGHGFAVKAQPYDVDTGEQILFCIYNLFDGNEAIGIKENFGVRNIGANYNVFKNGTATGFQAPPNAEDDNTYGYSIRGGASFNTFERNHVKWCNTAVEFYTNQENRDASWLHQEYKAEGNIIRNNLFEDNHFFWRYNHEHVTTSGGSTLTHSFNIENNELSNNTYSGIWEWSMTFDTASDFVFVNNVSRNNIYYNVGQHPIDPVNDNNNGWNFEVVQPWSFDNDLFFGGEGDVSSDPVLSWATNAVSVNPNIDANLNITGTTPASVLDGGVDIVNVAYDYTGRERVSGEYSLGAHDDIDVAPTPPTGPENFPAFQEASAISGVNPSAATDLDINYPSTVNLNDILIVAFSTAESNTFNTPAGWTQFESEDAANLSVAFFWKRADGTETGTITFSTVGVNNNMLGGVMYRFSDCVETGSPIEGLTEEAIGSQISTYDFSHTSNSLGDKRLAVAMFAVEDNLSVTDNSTGYTTNDDQSSIFGSDSRFIIATQQIADDTTADGTASYTASGNDYVKVIGFYLIPK